MAFTRRKILTIFFVFIFFSVTIQFVSWYFHYWQIKDRGKQFKIKLKFRIEVLTANFVASMVLDAVLGDEHHIEVERRVLAESKFE
jgi:hypothetical protein